MEAKTICLDTNILIDFFRKKNKKKSILFCLKEQYNFCISIICAFEIEIGLKTDIQKQEYEILLQNIKILPLDYPTVQNAVGIYKDLHNQNHLVEFADLLIASTAIPFNLPLATLNQKHFEHIKNLTLIDL